jgi:ATP-binding cassette subfamily B protein
MLMAAIGEIVSIGTVLPFLGALTTPNKVFDNEYAQPFISMFEITQPDQLLLPLTIVFSMAIVLSGTLRLLLLWTQSKLGYAIGADISYKIYRRTLYQPYSVHMNQNSSKVISGISKKANGTVSSTILPFMNLISSMIMLTMIFLVLSVVNFKMTVIALLSFGVIYALTILLNRKRLLSNSKNISEKTDYLIQIIQEGIGGIRDVIIDGTQELHCKIYKNSDISLRHSQASNQLMSESPKFGVEMLGMILIAWLAYNYVVVGESVDSIIPMLGVLVLGAQRMIPVLQQGYAGWSQMRGEQESLKDTLALLNQSIPEHMYTTDSSYEISFVDSIVFKQVGFSYSPDTDNVLINIDLKINKGDCIGIIGSTGSGKSTLLDILMGLLAPTNGGLFVDGIPVFDGSQRAWQKHIAHVPQAIFLSDTTIYENIAFGVPKDDIDYDRVHRVAEQAQVSEAIGDMKDKYNTMVGEQGVRLSGGQRQRIGIARALYKNASVIIFDEATSALDNETERSVMKAINKINPNITIVIVAHRLTTLENCNKIVRLEKGTVKKVGSYQEVINKY